MISGIRQKIASFMNLNPSLQFTPKMPRPFYRFGDTLSGGVKLTFPKPITTKSLVLKLEGILMNQNFNNERF